MVRVLDLGTGVKEYRENLKRGFEIDRDCLCCGNSRLHKHDSYTRTAIFGKQEARVVILRLRCSECGVTVSLLPNFLTPHKVYATAVREEAVSSVLNGVSMSEAASRITSLSRVSVSGWLKELSSKAASLTGRLLSHICEYGSPEGVLRQLACLNKDRFLPVRRLFEAGKHLLQVVSSRAGTPSGSPLLSRLNLYLTGEWV